MHKKTTSRSSNSSGALVSHEGFLTKQGGARGGFKNWKKRWFAIKRDCIFYYKTRPISSADEDQPLLGVLPLSGAAVLDMGEDGNGTDLCNAVCYECKRAFSMLYKRKRCSICSQCFCRLCIVHKVAVPSMGYDKPVRTCRKCYSSVVADKQMENRDDNQMNALKNRLQDEVGDRQNVFLIQTPDRELLVHAETAKEKDEWIAAIREGIGRRAMSSENQLAGKPIREQWEIDYSQLTFISKVGDGAFGEVFKGRLWGTDVAIKKLKDSELNEKVLIDLKKEVAILSQLRHPNVVLYIGACTVPPNVCIVTEWCDRGSLYDIIYKQKMIIDTRRAINISIGLAQGMSYLHSLDGNIIHRDLKSHNVLLDQNFTVKIADFGLSHMRELTAPNVEIAEAGAGKFGIFGTPEWMAPEVMEGSAYTNKIDVYSFGVVLTEIFNRQIPLRDQYKITTYVDVFEAVLDDGARPTIPVWIGTAMQTLIMNCLTVLPSQRPTFMELIARMTHMFHLSPKAICRQYDIKRLIFMLDNTRQYMQELAARELALIKPSNEPCSHCGQSSLSAVMLEHETVMLFLEKLTILLNGEITKTSNQFCLALVALLSCAPEKYRSSYSDIVLKEIGLGKLMSFCNSMDEELRMGARALLKLITPDFLRPENNAINELDKDTAINLQSLVEDEISQLTEKLEGVQSLVKLKKDLIETLQLRKFSSHSKRVAHRNTPSWNAYVHDQALVPVEELMMAGVVIGKIFPGPDIDVLPTSGILSSSFLQAFNFKSSDILHHDHALTYDQAMNTWVTSLIVIRKQELHIFEVGSGQSRNDNCLATIKIRQDCQVAIGRKHGKPHCIHICEDSDTMVICARSASIVRLWACLLNPDKFHDRPNSLIPCSMSKRDLLDMLAKMAVEGRTPPTDSSGWLLTLDRDTMLWYPAYARFEPMRPKIMALFETSHMNNAIMDISIDKVVFNHNPQDSDDSTSDGCDEEWGSRYFAVEGQRVDRSEVSRETKEIFEFCSISIGERHNWVDYCQRVGKPSLLSLEQARVDENVALSTLPPDIKDELMRNVDVRQKTDSDRTVTEDLVQQATKYESSSSFEDDELLLCDINDGQKLVHHVDFVKQFGDAAKYGYLLKRGGFRKNWKLRYFYLVKNQLRYFPCHNSVPSDCLGVIYTSTASGKRFTVYPDRSKKKFCFCIENPSRTWFLEAHSEEELQDWTSAIREAIGNMKETSGTIK